MAGPIVERTPTASRLRAYWAGLAIAWGLAVALVVRITPDPKT